MIFNFFFTSMKTDTHLKEVSELFTHFISELLWIASEISALKYLHFFLCTLDTILNEYELLE